MRATILSAVLTALAASAWAQGFRPMATAPVDSVPGGMNYQGRLEQNGFPVTGTRPIVFRLFDVATGGAALWDSGTQTVTVTQGLFSASLNIPFATLAGASQKYLELQVDGFTLAPRDPIGSVPYAKVAETVEGTIDVSTAGLTFTTPVGDSLAISSVSGRVGIGLNNPAARLHVSSGAGETSNIVMVSTGNSTLLTIDGNGKVKANSFEGDGTTLGNVVRKSGDGMVGSLTLNAPSTLTVLGSAFSVGSTDLVVSANRTGVGTAGPLSTLDVAGTFAASGRGVFGGSVTVRDAAQFGSGATVSSFSAAGALALNSNASLSVGTTFFVNNGRVGVGTASPSPLSRLHVLGDVMIGNTDLHDGSANSDLHVEGNVLVDGKFIQHGGGGSKFDILGVAAEAQAGQTFAVGFTSFVVRDTGNVGVATLLPASKLDVGGDFAAVGRAHFGGSVTVRNAAQFGSTGFSVFNTAGALSIASGQNVTVAGGAEVLGLPATPSATGAASKEFVEAQFGGGGLSPWTRDILAVPPEVVLNNIGDEVGIGTNDPLNKLDVAGTFSATGRGVFGGSVTVKGAAEFGPAGAGTGSRFDAAGALTIASAQNVTVSGGGAFSGSGAGLTAVPAASISAGTLGASVIASSVAASKVGADQLVNTAVAPGSYGSATQAATLTVDADGRLTAAGNATVTPAAGSITAGTLGASVIASSVAASKVGADQLVNTAVAPGSYGSATQAATLTVDADGRLTAAGNATVTPAAGSITAGTLIAGVNVPAANIQAGSLGASVIASSVAASRVGADQLVNTAVTPGSYGSATQAGTFTVDADGRLTAAGNATVTPAAASVQAGAFSGVFSFGARVGLAPFTSAALAPGGAAPAPTAQGQAVFNSTIQDICVSTDTVSGAWALAGSKGTGGCF